MGQSSKARASESREADLAADIERVTREAVALGLRVTDGARESAERLYPGRRERHPRPVENLGDYLFELARLNLRFHEQLIRLGHEYADRIFGPHHPDPHAHPHPHDPERRRIDLARTKTGATGELVLKRTRPSELTELTVKVPFQSDGEVRELVIPLAFTLTSTPTPEGDGFAIKVAVEAKPRIPAGNWCGKVTLPAPHVVIELFVSSAKTSQ
jgi:hypothetical protein